ncbi:hypothetical protein ELI15_14090 [Rhizobium ruizarguesonis]|uniref:hypothetical protein n=1 Tax=Rhizobium ruizarguesonis TaxID=2081791 RepID=UPI00102F961D|nr:hypothetical protein [Rhizobium ruizarguesonis]TAW65420.1 hypothetical protein ELI15_14090 [Rhizobium ruizarguesonis]
MSNATLIAANLRDLLNSTFAVDYPRCNFWVTVMDADFMQYPFVVLENTDADGSDQGVVFNLITSDQTDLTARRRTEAASDEKAEMLIDVFVDRREVRAFYRRDGWEGQCVRENVVIEFGDWFAEIALDDIYEAVEFPAVEVVA